jgi:signal transduction histidine kinase
VSLTVSPVRNAAGQVVGASKIARDISERRAFERIRQVLLEREQDARAEAEALSRSKDQFLATLSHELRTPLNAIYGWARMLDAGQLDAKSTRHATQAILRNAAAQVQLIEDLFDVSRVITGNMRLDVQPLNVSVVLEAALDTVRPAAATKRIRLESVLDPRAGPIMGDPGRLQQVAWNLLMNAVKFTPNGDECSSTCAGKFAHRDHGQRHRGRHRPDQLPHLFERFRQADAGPTRRHTGLGIGLSLARHLVELHGGTVTAESAGLGPWRHVHGQAAHVRGAASADTAPAARRSSAIRPEPRGRQTSLAPRPSRAGSG